MNALQENPQLTHQAVMRARQDGLDENSQIFHDRVRANFQLLSGVAVADVRLDGEVPEKANEFHKPSPAPRSKHVDDSDPVRSSLVSAPVSRETVANGSYNSHGERPGQVRLTPQQKDHARAAGVSLEEYALGVLRLREEKNQGRYGGEQ